MYLFTYKIKSFNFVRNFVAYIYKVGRLDTCSSIVGTPTYFIQNKCFSKLIDKLHSTNIKKEPTANKIKEEKKKYKE